MQPSLDQLPAKKLAVALLSGLVGFELFHTLERDFPDIRRADVFFGIALAWTELQASLLACEVEIRALKAQVGLREAA